MNSAGKRTRNAKRAPKQDGNQRPAKRSRTASPLTREESIASGTKSSSSQTEQLAPYLKSESESQETLREETDYVHPEAKANEEQAKDGDQGAGQEQGGNEEQGKEEEEVEDYSPEQLESDLNWLADDYAKYILVKCAREIPAVAQRVQKARRIVDDNIEDAFRIHASYTQRAKDSVHEALLDPDMGDDEMEGFSNAIEDSLFKLTQQLYAAGNFPDIDTKYSVLENMLEIFDAVLGDQKNGVANELCGYLNHERSNDRIDDWGHYFLDVFAGLTWVEKQRLRDHEVDGPHGLERWYSRLDRCVQSTEGHGFLRSLRLVYGLMCQWMPEFLADDD